MRQDAGCARSGSGEGGDLGHIRLQGIMPNPSGRELGNRQHDLVDQRPGLAQKCGGFRVQRASVECCTRSGKPRWFRPFQRSHIRRRRHFLRRIQFSA